MMEEIENVIVEDGKIIDPISEKVLGEVGIVELSVEMPPERLGIYRIKSIRVYDTAETMEFNDQEKVDNQEFFSEEEIKEFLAEAYGILPECIETV